MYVGIYIILHVFGCVHLCVYNCAAIYGSWGQSWKSFFSSHQLLIFFFWDGFSLFWKWPDKLGWLVWKLQGSDYLCLSSGLQIGPSTLDLLKVCSGDWTCHHVCKASSLLTRYFSRCILKVKDKYFLEV